MGSCEPQATGDRHRLSRPESVIHGLALKGVLLLHGRMGLPAMTGTERRLFKRLLSHIAAARAGRVRVFEYGSGYSTTYFARWMASKGIDFHIDSIDNHEGWHRRVRQRVHRLRLEDRVTLHLREFAPFWLKSGWNWDVAPECGRFAPSSDEENEYVGLPLALGGDYDLVVVDARFRRRCLEVAGRALAPGGLVVLHDAQKVHYHQPLAHFAVGRMFDGGEYYPFERRARRWKVWIGSQSPNIVEGL